MTLTSHRVVSDIFNLENVVQQTGIVHSKNMIIDVLRNLFAQDREYKYVSDVFGFPLTPSHLGLDPDAGLDDEETTRIFIGSTYRLDAKMNPSVIVKSTGGGYTPISFNQNIYGVINSLEKIIDSEGNVSIVRTPAYSTLAGAWDQKFEIKVITENEVDREEITDIINVSLMGTRRMELQDAGLFIKTLTFAGESEEDYANDKLYTSVITLDTRTEWKINIPISNIIERIGICLTFNTIGGVASDTLSVNETIELADSI